MKALYDASAFTNLIVQSGEEALDLLRGGFVLDLTSYEVGNAVLHMHIKAKKITKPQADVLLDACGRAIMRMQALTCQPTELALIEEVALARKLTFYDAAYLYTAKKEGLPLVTDDLRLIKAAVDLKVHSSADIASKA